ncbi:MAG: M15 family metallopeptidase [Actinobacteria bacterium]|nr:M15 family metallopeptidase [Actinomycetota bacterium]
MPKLALLAATALLATPLAGAATPQFSAVITRVAADDLPHSYRPGCPVSPSQLRAVRLRHWAFDGKLHTGVLVVHATVARDVVAVFRRLYRARFPIRRMRPVDAYRGSDEASLAADNTSAFNCRYAVAGGPRRWSTHAFGKAIDVNPVENPYLDRGVVRPPRGRRYLDRSRRRPGMALPGGVLVEAFDGAGWSWGGRWSGSPDYQHFSATGG